MPPRTRPYNRISQQDRDRIIAAYRAGNDYIQLATQLGVNKKTARSIIRKLLATGETAPRRRGGARRQIVNQQMKNEIEQIVHRHPQYTLNQINQELRTALPNQPHIHRSTLAKTLDKMLITVKQLQTVNEEWHRPDVLDARVDYVNWFHQGGINNHLVYIDECGYNIYTSRNRGRAPRGFQAVRQVDSQRSRPKYDGMPCNFCHAWISSLGHIFGWPNAAEIPRNCYTAV